MAKKTENEDGTRYFCSDDGFFCSLDDNGDCPDCSYNHNDDVVN